MPERIAVKRLTQSDLTFVDWHFQQKSFGESRQKAINLNRDVLVDSLFPDLANNPQARMDVLLTVYGPGGAPAFTPPIPTRPILNNNAKNWRLNGQTLPDDPSIPNRFHDLKPDDLALMVFRGWPQPSEIDLIFVSSVEDTAVYSVLNPLIGQGRQSMAAVTRDALHALLNQVNLENDHPLSSLLEEDKPEIVQSAIEEAIHGGAASSVLRRRRGGPKLTPVELSEARERASEIGSDGEQILYGWLRSQEDAGQIKNLDWVARRDAAAPYDFTFERAGQLVQLDAKSTNGPFSRKFHVSYSEIIAAAESSSYSIARIYELSEHGAKVRLFGDFRNTAKAILASTSLPEGVIPTGFSIASTTLAFEPEFSVEWTLDA